MVYFHIYVREVYEWPWWSHFEAQGEEVWDAVENDVFVPTSVINGVGTTKIKSLWTDDDKKKVFYDKKEKDLLQAALSMDEFCCVSQCKMAKEIWDMLVVTHDEITEVKRSRFNILCKITICSRCSPMNQFLTCRKYLCAWQITW